MLDRLDRSSLLTRAREFIEQAMKQRPLIRAWERLRSGDGPATRGAAPYTDEAIKDLTAAHESDPEDCGVLHHLAIAHHSRAWDLEISDGTAAREWEIALEYWRALASKPAFWARQHEKVRALDADVDPTFLTELRRNLLGYLIEIHVDFVRHYVEREEVERARAHVALIERAPIAPALRRRFVDRLFDTVVVSAQAERAGDNATSIAAAERFLELFPRHLPALRVHAEASAELLDTLSFQDDWDRIVEVASNADPIASALLEHPDLAADPLAKPALLDVARHVAMRAIDRGSGELGAQDPERMPVVARESAVEAFELAIRWARVGHSIASGDSQAAQLLAASLNRRVECLFFELKEVAQSREAPAVKSDASTRLMERAVTLLEEANRVAPGDCVLESNLATARKSLENVRRGKREQGLLGKLGGLFQ